MSWTEILNWTSEFCSSSIWHQIIILWGWTLTSDRPSAFSWSNQSFIVTFGSTAAAEPSYDLIDPFWIKLRGLCFTVMTKPGFCQQLQMEERNDSLEVKKSSFLWTSDQFSEESSCSILLTDTFTLQHGRSCSWNCRRKPSTNYKEKHDASGERRENNGSARLLI